MAVWGTDIENGETASVAGGTTMGETSAFTGGGAAIADAMPAASRNNPRLDGSLKSDLPGFFCIGLRPLKGVLSR